MLGGRVLPREVPLAHLPPRLDGLRIVHLSDLHMGDFMPRAALRRAVDMINAVQPDLAVLTGDLITSAPDPPAERLPVLRRFLLRVGVSVAGDSRVRWVAV